MLLTKNHYLTNIGAIILITFLLPWLHVHLLRKINTKMGKYTERIANNSISESDLCLSEAFLIVFVFVLIGWSLLLNALRPFKIYCAPPNLGITRT